MSTDSIISQRLAGFPPGGVGPASVVDSLTTDFTVIATRGQVGPQQRGFTLVEISLTLVIIGILIGGILKGMELVQNSRVRTVATTTTSIQAAYFAFYDRYGRVAGDWNAVAAGNAIGRTVNGGGNDSGHLDTTPGDPWTESNAFWEQLAKAGFINGTYQGTPGTEPTPVNDLTPLNVFRRPMMIGRTPDYEGSGVPRRHIVVGRGTPVGLLRELDTKIDDGKPDRGRVRATVDDGGVSVFGGANSWGGRESACVDAAPIWNVNAGATDCNALLLF